MINFKKIDEWELDGKKIITVQNPIRSDEYAWCDDYFFLKGMIVKIEDKFYKIHAVERFCYLGKRRLNDPIGIMVTEETI